MTGASCRWLFLLLFFLVIFSVGCAPLTHDMHMSFGDTKSLTDPFVTVNTGQSIGLVARSSFVKEIDPLLERTLLSDCQHELVKRGFKVQLIDESQIKQEEGNWSLELSEGLPDLILMAQAEAEHWQETIPESGTHRGSFSEYGGRSSSDYVGEHKVDRYSSGVVISLRGGNPHYTKEIWRAESRVLGNRVVDHHAVLIETLFRNEFPIQVPESAE
ncbi:MAG: hypothetical protein ACON4H_09150 [Rubripirellula sp.]